MNQTNIRKQFVLAQWAVIIFFFYAFAGGLIVITNGHKSLNIVSIIAILLSLPVGLWTLSKMKGFSQDEDFFKDYDELLELKKKYEEAIETWNHRIVAIGEHEAIKMLNNEQEAQECDTTKAQ
jgi:hypothetical protein